MTGGVTPPAERHSSGPTVRCPECLELRDPARPAGLFCCPQHKTAFTNRQTVRGRVLTPLVMAERVTRSGSTRDKATGIRARQDSRRLMDLWNRQDRQAGRMAMDEYLALRHRLGFYSFLDTK